MNVLIHVIKSPHISYNSVYGRNENNNNNNNNNKKKNVKNSTNDKKGNSSERINEVVGSGINSFFKIIQEHMGVYASDFDEGEESESDFSGTKEDKKKKKKKKKKKNKEKNKSSNNNNNNIKEKKNLLELLNVKEEDFINEGDENCEEDVKDEDKENNSDNNKNDDKKKKDNKKKKVDKRNENKNENESSKEDEEKGLDKVPKKKKSKEKNVSKENNIKTEIIINSEEESEEDYSYSDNMSDNNSSSSTSECTIESENEKFFLSNINCVDVKYITIIYTATCCIYTILDIYPNSIKYIINNKEAVYILNKKLNDIEYIDVAEVILKIFEKLVEKDPMLILKKKSIKYMLMHIDFYNVNIQKKIFFCIIQMINNITKYRHITKYITPYCNIFINFFHYHYIHILNIICTLWRSFLDKMITLRLEEERLAMEDMLGICRNKKDNERTSYLSKLIEKKKDKKKSKKKNGNINANVNILDDGVRPEKRKTKGNNIKVTPIYDNDIIEISDEDESVNLMDKNIRKKGSVSGSKGKRKKTTSNDKIRGEDINDVVVTNESFQDCNNKSNSNNNEDMEDNHNNNNNNNNGDKSKSRDRNKLKTNYNNKLLLNMIHLNSDDNIYYKLSSEIESIYNINIRDNIIKLLIECQIEDNLYAFMETFYIISILVHYSNNVLEDFCKSEFLNKFNEFFGNKKFRSNNFLIIYILFTLYSFLPMCTYNGKLIYEYDNKRDIKDEIFYENIGEFINDEITKKKKNIDNIDNIENIENAKNVENNMNVENAKNVQNNKNVENAKNVQNNKNDKDFINTSCRYNNKFGMLVYKFPIDVKKYKLTFYKNNLAHLFTLIKIVIPNIYYIYEETLYYDIKYLCILICLSVFISLYKISLTCYERVEFLNCLKYIFSYNKEMYSFLRSVILNHLSETSVISGITICKIVAHFTLLILKNPDSSILDVNNVENEVSNILKCINKNEDVNGGLLFNITHLMRDYNNRYLYVLLHIVHKILLKKKEEILEWEDKKESSSICFNKKIYNIIFMYFYDIFNNKMYIKKNDDKGCNNSTKDLLFFNRDREIMNVFLEYSELFFNYEKEKKITRQGGNICSYFKNENIKEELGFDEIVVIKNFIHSEEKCYNNMILCYYYLIYLFSNLSEKKEDSCIYFYQYNIGKRLYFFLYQSLLYGNNMKECNMNVSKYYTQDMIIKEKNKMDVLELLKSIDRNIRLYIFLYALLFVNNKRKEDMVHGLFLNSIKRIYKIFSENMLGEKNIEDINSNDIMHIKSLVVKIFDSYHYYLIINNLSFKSCYELIKIIKECLNIYDHFPIYFFKDNFSSKNNTKRVCANKFYDYINVNDPKGKGEGDGECD
ncbi:hypothetical protein PFMALIP_01653, partial [Plasmodium falciparum MaliPS096_E11]